MLNTYMQDYYNPFHGFELTPGVNQDGQRGNENGILFMGVYLTLRYIRHEITLDEVDAFYATVRNLEVEPGLYDRGAGESETIPVEKRRSVSHDNISAISSVNTLLGTIYPKEQDFAKDIAVYGLKNGFVYNNIKPRFRWPMNPSNWSIWLAQGGYKLLAIPFLPFMAINILITTARPPENTSSKQLCFVELYPVRNTLMFGWMWKIYKYRMKKMYGVDWLNKMFSIYYRHPDHPIRKLSEGIEL